MMNNGIFDMIVKPINDVWQKTEEATRIILVPEVPNSLNLHVSINVNHRLRFKGPMPTNPFLAEVLTPHFTPDGIQFIPTLARFLPIKPTVPISTNDEINAGKERRTSHNDGINYCDAKTISKSSKIRHQSEANKSVHKYEISKSSSMPDSMQTASCEERTLLPAPSNEILDQHQCNEEDLSCFINLGIVYFRLINERIKKALSKVAKIHKKGIPKLVKRLRELKTNNAKFVKTLHNLQMECDNLLSNKIEEHPEFIILKEYADKIVHNYDQLTYGTLKDFLPSENISVRSEHFLCSLLGLRLSVADSLIDINPEMRCHQDDSYWIIKYLEKNEPTSYSDDFRKDFASLGFTDERAEYLAACLKNHQFESHMSLLEWAIRYVEWAFKYDALLNQSYSDDPLPGKLGEEQVMRIKEDEDDANMGEKSNNVIKGIKLNSGNELQNVRTQSYLIDQGTDLQGNLQLYLTINQYCYNFNS